MESEVDEIIQSSSWNILGCLFNIRIWDQPLSLKDLEFVFAEFWIQIHNISVEYMDSDNVNKIGNKLGKLVELDILVI